MSPESKTDYTQMMKAELIQVIDALGIGDLQKKFLKSRWLDQLLWMEHAAKKNQRSYYALRLACIIGGVIIPALVSLKLQGGMDIFVRVVTIMLSLVVAVSAAIEEFFHFGERWRHYRRNAGLLKTEGWSFFQLTGRYQGQADHGEAYPTFAGHIEQTFEKEMETFISKISKEKDAKKDAPDV
jgi:hypothetical protein